MLNTRESNLREIGIGVLATLNILRGRGGGGLDCRLDPVRRCKDRATLPSHNTEDARRTCVLVHRSL
jgi:hypothetical protein